MIQKFGLRIRDFDGFTGFRAPSSPNWDSQNFQSDPTKTTGTIWGSRLYAQVGVNSGPDPGV